MRTRLIRAGFFANEDLAALAPHARLLFVGLWLLADRAGRLRDQPPVIRANLFPYETGVEVDALLDDLARAGFVLRYTGSTGQRCLQIVNFGTHQNPHHREPESKLPPEPNSLKNARKNPKPRKHRGTAAAEPRNGPPNTDPDTDTDTNTNTAAAAEPGPGRGSAPLSLDALAVVALDAVLADEHTDDRGRVLTRLQLLARSTAAGWDLAQAAAAVEAACEARARKASEFFDLIRRRATG